LRPQTAQRRNESIRNDFQSRVIKCSNLIKISARPAKGGQNGFHRSLATELAPFGITVNIISPGWVPFERHEKEPQSEKAAYRELIPADRWGVPEDLAGAVIFLASGAASFITGQNVCINGGLTVS